MDLTADLGCVFIDPTDEKVIVGQATACVEFAKQVHEQTCQNLDAVILPCGGGSLLAGSAVFFGGSGTRVFGAEPEHGGPRLAESLRRKTRLDYNASSTTLADGLGILVWERNWSILQRPELLAGAFAVSDSAILQSLQSHRLVSNHVVEPSGIVALTATLFHDSVISFFPPVSKKTWRLGIILTGRNINQDTLDQLLSGLDRMGS
jgi:threonine dehydratase